MQYGDFTWVVSAVNWLRRPSARMTGGARRSPLEDSGGMPGFEEFLDALADPAHPGAEQSARVAETTGTDEPGFMDVVAINRELILVLLQWRTAQTSGTGPGLT